MSDELKVMDSLTIKPIKTGWKVEVTGETRRILADGRNDTDYLNEEYAFADLPSALAKASELAPTLSME